VSATFPAVAFPARGVVEVRVLPDTAVPAPGAHPIRWRARTSLVSTGSESF
jgi:hypothetical protein